VRNITIGRRTIYFASASAAVVEILKNIKNIKEQLKYYEILNTSSHSLYRYGSTGVI